MIVCLDKAKPRRRRTARQAALERIVDAQEAVVREHFRAFIEAFDDADLFNLIASHLEAGDVQGAMALADQYVARFSLVIPKIIQGMGEAEAFYLAAQLAKPAAKAVAVSFDPTFPRAAEIIRESKLDLITRFTAQQRAATRQALDRAFMQGLGTRETARAFRNSIGLTAFQEQAVFNYRTLLENGSRQALDRAMRDRRFDPTVARSIEEGGTLTNAQIDRMTAAYRRRALITRSETIARTEATRAASLANAEAARQMVEFTGMDPSRVVRVWYATRDQRTRDAHAWMDNQRRGLEEPFQDQDGNLLMVPGDPEAPAGTTINCRCRVVLEIKGPQGSTNA